jgi:hypothetical protein
VELVFKIAWKLSPRQKRERAPNHPSPPLKEKEKGGEGGSMLGGQWKIPCLVVMEHPMLGGQ